MNNNELVEYKDIFDNINVQNWFKSIALKEPLAFSTLCSGNKKRFENIFGKRNGSSKNNEYDYWVVQEQGLNFIISSSNESTYYLVKYFGDDFNINIKTGSYLIMFIRKIMRLITNN